MTPPQLQMRTTVITSSTPRPAAIYARYSTDRQDARSIEDQVRRCREFAARNHITVVGVFADEAVSGSHTNRPELQRLLNEVTSSRTRSFGVILIDDLSRLSRDIWDMGTIVFQQLPACGAVVIDVMTQTPSDAPHARMLFTSLGMGND